MSDTSFSTASTGSARAAVTAVIALVFVIWTLAAVITLVYWSGTALWVLAALGLAGFIWTLKVYLRPSGSATDT